MTTEALATAFHEVAAAIKRRPFSADNTSLGANDNGPSSSSSCTCGRHYYYHYYLFASKQKVKEESAVQNTENIKGTARV